jgi:hypothetical protein
MKSFFKSLIKIFILTFKEHRTQQLEISAKETQNELLGKVVAVKTSFENFK